MASDKIEQENGTLQRKRTQPDTTPHISEPSLTSSERNSQASAHQEYSDQECESGTAPRTWGFFEVLAETRRRHMLAQQAPPVISPRWIPCEALNSRPKPPRTLLQAPHVQPLDGPPREQCFVCIACIAPYLAELPEVVQGHKIAHGFSLGKAVEVWGIPLIMDTFDEGSIEDRLYRDYYWRIVVAQLSGREDSMVDEQPPPMETAPVIGVRRRICAGGRILFEGKCDRHGWIPLVETANEHWDTIAVHLRKCLG